jgi:hypothetical protein
VILNVHSSIQQYHGTIQTMSFGEHCTKLKNMIAPHKISGISTNFSAADAPAEMVQQINELQKYAEELESENGDLRERLEGMRLSICVFSFFLVSNIFLISVGKPSCRWELPNSSDSTPDGRGSCHGSRCGSGSSSRGGSSLGAGASDFQLAAAAIGPISGADEPTQS